MNGTLMRGFYDKERGECQDNTQNGILNGTHCLLVAVYGHEQVGPESMLIQVMIGDRGSDSPTLRWKLGKGSK